MRCAARWDITETQLTSHDIDKAQQVGHRRSLFVALTQRCTSERELCGMGAVAINYDATRQTVGVA